jgi:leucine dehydrogenase
MQKNSNLPTQTPTEIVKILKEYKINRFYFVFDDNEKILLSSHEILQPIADFFSNDKRDFSEHEGLFFQLNQKYDTLMGAFVHKTKRGQAAGGVRYWHYNTIEDYFRDGIRLAKGMTQKNALANIWWGGGKGVICHNPEVDKFDPLIRKEIYREYGEFLTDLRGCYVTAEDAGTNVNDMENIFSRTRFTTCIPEKLGGSGNPSVPTARGIISGMEAALNFLYSNNLEGKVVAVQGMGNVGGPLIRFLIEKGVKKVIACDINPGIVEKLKSELNTDRLEARVADSKDHSIIFSECDIFSPCATGAILNDRTIAGIKAKIVCGAANNQLEDPLRDDPLLFENDICYIPDFLTNRMGIVNCANEQYGYVSNDYFIERHLDREWENSIYQTSLSVLKNSKANNQPTARVAIKIADEMANIPHPLFGHRGKQIINSLVENNLFCPGKQ